MASTEVIMQRIFLYMLPIFLIISTGNGISRRKEINVFKDLIITKKLASKKVGCPAGVTQWIESWPAN